MAGEQTLSLTLKVDDQGSVVLDKFTKKIQDTGNSIQNSLDVIAASAYVQLAATAERAAESIYNFAQREADLGRQIAENSRTLGMSTNAYQEWAYVAGQAGASSENLMNSMKFLSRSIMEAQDGSGRGGKALEAMGLSVRDASGKVKDFDTLMMQIISKFGQWQDGPNKMALGMALFGRGFLDIMPVINKGTDGIMRLKDEAEKAGAVIGQTTVEQLAKSAASFEKLSSVWKAFTAEVLSPMVSVLARILGLVSDVVGGLRKLPSGAGPGAYSPESQMYEAIGLTGGAGGQGGGQGGGAGAGSAAGKKTEAPSTDPYVRLGLTKQIAEDGIKTAKDYYAQWMQNWEIESKVYEVEKNLAEVQANDMFPSLEKVTTMVNKGNEYFKTQQEQLEKSKNLIKEMDWADAATGVTDLSSGLERLGNTWKIANEKAAASMVDYGAIVKSFGDNLSSSWATNMTNMIKGSQTFAQTVKNIFSGIGDAFISTITKMIANWLIFGSLTGKANASGQYGGLVGGIGSLLKLQAGGLVTHPTPALIGESGPEAVIPLHGGKIPIEGGGGGDSYVVVNQVQVTDPGTFTKIYGGVVKKLSEQSAWEARRLSKISTRI